ncbi:tRNA-dihydrouridine(47) synthase -like [Oopsacas minuta]|uniref:tRNA-dihydrouridine(47) synthase -like n=1 Tax=Oopsacas minuta TaxID=111878 RepID=A0AAV7K6N2_9METZ|nr:tRNA-dihydrouridine(47) synthase -like [Oopsacas minuta]
MTSLSSFYLLIHLLYQILALLKFISHYLMLIILIIYKHKPWGLTCFCYISTVVSIVLATESEVLVTSPTDSSLRSAGIAAVKKEYILKRVREDASGDGKQGKKKARGQNKHRPRSARELPHHRLCRSIVRGSQCSAIPNCRFLHSVDDYLANKPADLGDKCILYERDGECPYGVTCRFMKGHSQTGKVVDRVKREKQPSNYNFLYSQLRKGKVDLPRSDKYLQTMDSKNNSSKEIAKTESTDNSVNSTVIPIQTVTPVDYIDIDRSTGLIYVTDEKPFGRVSIFSSCLEFITTFTHVELNYPLVIFLTRDNVYVSDWNICNLFHFSEDSGYCKISNVNCLNTPSTEYVNAHGFAFSEHEDLYIPDPCLNNIRVLDANHFTYKSCITHPSLIRPCIIRISSDILYVKLLRASREILLFTLDGNNINSSLTQELRNPLIKTHNFWVDPYNGNLIISDMKVIQIFSQQAKHLHTIDVIDKSMIPVNVAVTCDNNIVVLYYDSRAVVYAFTCF